MEIDITKDSNLNSILYDALQGDTDLIRDFGVYDELSMDRILRGVDYIVNNESLSTSEKLDLLTNSWRIIYRVKPPTPQEFLGPPYLGAGVTIYPRIKNSFIEFADDKYRNAVLFPFIGFGKMLLNSSTIKTYEGEKTIDQIKIGDKICNPDGGISKVLNIFPQGKQKLYKFTFMDGREVIAGLEHQWKTSQYCNNLVWNKKYDKITPERIWKVVTTQEIIEDMSKNPKHRWCIPLTKPVEHKEQEHKISPYILGSLLGDGYIPVKNEVSLCGNDVEIFERVISELTEDQKSYRFVDRELRHYKMSVRYKLFFRMTNDIAYQLAKLGLSGKKSHEKFIPQEYLYDSIENRISLLQGLMDTNGTSNNNRARISFSTPSPFLVRDIQTLVRGLGGLSSVSSHDRTKTKPNTNNIEYIVSISFPNNDFSVFSLKRKQEKVNNRFERERTRKGTQNLLIKSIVQVEDGEATCIMVDHDEHLYLCNDYIVTHNSYLSVLWNLYTTTHLSLMHNAKKYLGLSEASNIYQVFASYNLTKSAEILLEPTINILESSEFFEQVRTKKDIAKKRNEYEKKGLIDNKLYWTQASRNRISSLQFANGVQYKLASTPNAILGLSLVSVVLTELAFFREAGKTEEFILQFFNDSKSRVWSRLKNPYYRYGLNYWGRVILDSSPNNIESVVDQYCMFEANKDPKNYVIKGSHWDWVPEDYENLDDRFPVFKGGNGKPPILLTSTEGYDASDILMVPKQLHQMFHDDLRKALKDLGGIPQGNMDKLFYDYEKINNCFIPQLRSVEFCIRADAKMSPHNLIWNQIRDTFFEKSGFGYRFYYKPTVPRVIHIDQSVSTDMSAIAVLHIERRKDIEGNFDKDRDVIYVVDMVIPIHPFGGRINLEAIKEFIVDIFTLGAIPITGISYDQFQSESSIQALERMELPIQKISVDSEMDPYLYLAQQVEQGNLKLGRNIFFKNNLKSLRVTQRPRTKSLKIDHTMGDSPNPSNADYSWDNSLLGINAKDVSDAVAGAMTLARQILTTDGRFLTQVFDEAKIERSYDDICNNTMAQIKNLGFVI